MSHAQCTWLDRILLSPPHSTPSLLCLLNWSILCNPQHGVQFGRFAELCFVTVYDEPNDPVEVRSTEVTTMLSPPRRASIGSTSNSGEETATTPASSEVGERPNLGLLALLLLTQTRGKCSPIQDLSLSHGKMLCQVHHTFQSVQGDLWRCTHTTEVKSGYKCFQGVLFREREREKKNTFFYWASRNLRFS